MMETPLHTRIAKHEAQYGKERLFEDLGVAFLNAYLASGVGAQLRNRSLARLVELPEAQETITTQQQLSTVLRQEVIKTFNGVDDGYRTDVRRKLQELCRGEPTPHSLDGAIYKICARNLFSAEVLSWENVSIREIGQRVYQAVTAERPTSSLAEIQTLMKGIAAYTRTYTPGK